MRKVESLKRIVRFYRCMIEGMDWLNYHHLLYFWTVARTGSIAAAAKELRLASPTISNQIKQLEESLGEKLLVKTGRRLVLTDKGRIAMRYADEIFSLGREFTDTMKDRPTGRPLRTSVGIADVLPKVVAFRLLEPALRISLPVRLVCHEDRSDLLIGKLVSHEIDVMLSDAPVQAEAGVRAFSRLLGETEIGFFSRHKLTARKPRYPKQLDGAGVLLPTENTMLRRDLDHWFYDVGVRPRVIAEFEDFALLRVFGEQGYGAFPAPSFLAREFRRSGLHLIGRIPAIRMRVFATTVERRVSHPAVEAVLARAVSALA